MATKAMHEFDHKDLNRKSIFGTDGIRGNAEKTFTPRFVFQLGYAAGLALPKDRPVIIGNDSRESCPMIIKALTDGLTYSGREVWELGLCPTPAVPFLINKFKVSGGLMVSASHNQPSDNGIKFFSSNGNKINNQEQELIEKIIRSENLDRKGYGVTYKKNDLLELYKQSLLNSIGNKKLQNSKIVLDLCWGSATVFGDEVFKEAGSEVFIINGEPNGKKINVNCGSTNLKQLQQAVIENAADIGFAFDGDADRLIAIDENARIVNGDHILYLWGSYLKGKNELNDNRLVTTIMSNLGFEKEWIAQGGIFDRTLVGDQNVHAKMISKKANLGGEQSGHILSSINGLCGDGLLTALQISNIANLIGLSLKEWLDLSFKPYPQKLINVPLNKKVNNQSWSSSQIIKDLLNKAKIELGEHGRVLIRESGTEPLLRVMVESRDKDLADSWSTHLAEIASNNLNVA